MTLKDAQIHKLPVANFTPVYLGRLRLMRLLVFREVAGACERLRADFADERRLVGGGMLQ